MARGHIDCPYRWHLSALLVPDVNKVATPERLKLKYSPGWIIFIFTLANVMSYRSSSRAWNYDGLLVTIVDTLFELWWDILAATALATVQETLNKIWQKAQPHLKMRTAFSAGEIVCMVLGGLFLVFTISMRFVPEPPDFDYQQFEEQFEQDGIDFDGQEDMSQVLPDEYMEPDSDDQDFVALRAALTDGGVAHDDIKLIMNLPDEGEHGKIFGLIVPGRQAVSTWMELRALVPQTNRWPLIMGDPEIIDSDYFAIMEEDDESVRDILGRVDNVDIGQWMAEAIEANPERYAVSPDSWPEGGGEAPPAEEMITSHIDFEDDRPLSFVLIGLFPVSEGWQVPAVMKWGNWNECPAPEIHCAILREWGEKYGAELIGITGDMLEVKVQSNPITREEALELARLQYVYCPDSVDQGPAPIEGLAYYCLHFPVWSFWWD
jgi:hypothetical protein